MDGVLAALRLVGPRCRSLQLTCKALWGWDQAAVDARKAAVQRCVASATLGLLALLPDDHLFVERAAECWRRGLVDPYQLRVLDRRDPNARGAKALRLLVLNPLRRPLHSVCCSTYCRRMSSVSSTNRSAALAFGTP